MKILTFLFIVVFATPASGSLYWNNGVRSKYISVCFVSNAVDDFPDRIEEIKEDLTHFSRVANITFTGFGKCVDPVRVGGKDYHAGDIRVIIPNLDQTGTGVVPGKGCTAFIVDGSYNGKNDDWGSWSNAPDDLDQRRPCLYNLKLGNDPWKTGVRPYTDTTLHEFGHALGLAHEHVRDDANLNCTEEDYGGGNKSAKMTPYDRDSVMHYKFASCGVNGNYDYKGFSKYDALALHIMYPENDKVAEVEGNLLVKSGEWFDLSSRWKKRGANMSFVASDHVWKINGKIYSRNDYFNSRLNAGRYNLEYTHKDFLGRSYSYKAKIVVMSGSDIARKVISPIVTSLPLF